MHSVDLESQKAFAETVFSQTRERIHQKANATIKRHEDKYKTRVYLPGEVVLVDVGLKSKVKKKRSMEKATIIEALTNNFYTVEFTSGPNIGDQQDIDADLIEPLQKKERVMSEVVPERKEKSKKKTKSNQKKVTEKVPKPNPTAKVESTEKNRSESHWFKQTGNLLTMDRSGRSARAKVFNKNEE